MREILFKGKRIADGKWVDGYYFKMSETTYCFEEDYERNPVPEHHYILQERMTDWGLPNRIAMYEVDPKTLCEYTGLTDKNGNKIWENDIIKRYYKHSAYNYALVKYGRYLDYRKLEHVGFYVDWDLSKEPDLIKRLCYWANNIDGIETENIGSVFDNPGLLEEGKRE